MEAIGIITGGIGVFLSLFGYKYLKNVMLILSFICGFILSLYLGQIFDIGNVPTRFLAGVSIGIGFSFLIHMAFEFGIFVVGALGGAAIFIIYQISATQSFLLDQQLLLGITLSATIGGISSLVLRKYVLILSTSLIGSILITITSILFSSTLNFENPLGDQLSTINPSNYYFVFLATLLFGILSQGGFINFLIKQAANRIPQSEEKFTEKAMEESKINNFTKSSDNSYSAHGLTQYSHKENLPTNQPLSHESHLNENLSESETKSE